MATAATAHDRVTRRGDWRRGWAGVGTRVRTPGTVDL